MKSIKIKSDHLIITTSNPDQKMKLLHATEICGNLIEVNLPRDKQNLPRDKQNILLALNLPDTLNLRQIPTIEEQQKCKGIIFGVSVEIENEEILLETNAIEARRITKIIDGHRVEQENTILTFHGTDLPYHVNIGFIKYKVKAYIPLPFRCSNCQRFGHRNSECYRQVCCPRCSGSHLFQNCPHKENKTHAKCANCHGQHSAAWTGCPKYQQTKQMLSVAVTNKISYKDALLRVKINEQNQPNEELEQVSANNEDHTEHTDELTACTSRDNSNQNHPATAEHDHHQHLHDNTNKSRNSSTSRKLSSSRKELKSINSLEVKIVTLEKTVIDLKTKNDEMVNILKFAVIAIMITLERTFSSPEDSENYEIYRNTLGAMAETAGIDISEVWKPVSQDSPTSE